MICEYCRSSIQSDSKTCDKCGALVEENRDFYSLLSDDKKNLFWNVVLKKSVVKLGGHTYNLGVEVLPEREFNKIAMDVYNGVIKEEDYCG